MKKFDGVYRHKSEFRALSMSFGGVIWAVGRINALFRKSGQISAAE